MEHEYENFLVQLFGPCYIVQESDYILKGEKEAGINYFPLPIWNLIRTSPVKRMARIFQNGTKNYVYSNMTHTRLEHSKGTYYRTLDLLVYLSQNQNVARLIQEKGYEKYLIAELVRALLHDDGHGPFSHTLETVCNLPKGFHEDIGIRMLQENKELKDSLDDIYPNLPELIEKVTKGNFLGLNCLFEGNLDVDRGDFLPRDNWFAQKDYSKIQQSIVEAFHHFQLSKIEDEQGKERLVPVFDESQLDNIETILEERFYNYYHIYYNNYCVAYDYIFKAFAEELMKSEEECPLKDFLLEMQGKTAAEVDLDVYLSMDDISYFQSIIEVAKTTKNPVLKKLAYLSLPNKRNISGIYYGLMVSEEQMDGESQVILSSSDKKFIKELSQLQNENCPLGKIVAADNYFQENCLVPDTDSQEEIVILSEQIQEQLGHLSEEEQNEKGMIVWSQKISSYKPKKGEEIYVSSSDGDVYEYSKHPKRKKEIIQKEKYGMCILVPYLEKAGYSKEQILQVKQIVRDFNLQKQIMKQEKNPSKQLSKKELEALVFEH